MKRKKAIHSTDILRRPVLMLCLLLGLQAKVLISQDIYYSVDSTKIEDIFLEIPSFTIYQDNYFATGTSLQEAPSSDNSDAKFEIGFKQRLTSKAFPGHSYIFFTYRQKAFWDIYKESFPFRELNYNPGITLFKPIFKQGSINGILSLSLEHESNGRDEENSRSWNFLALSYTAYIGSRVKLGGKLWLPIGSLRDNPDLLDYKGDGHVDFVYKFHHNLIAEFKRQQSLGDGWRGSTQINLNYRISRRSNQFIYLQYFGGYAEDLILYEEKRRMLRIGIVFKDLFLSFKKKHHMKAKMPQIGKS